MAEVTGGSGEASGAANSTAAYKPDPPTVNSDCVAGYLTDPRPWPKPLVYVAGPYTRPDPVVNTRNACLVADELVALGAAVMVPHLSLLWHAISPAPIEAWYERDIDVLRHCNAVVLLPGTSTGADAEVAEARHLGLTVYSWPADRDTFRRYVEGCGA